MPAEVLIKNFHGRQSIRSGESFMMRRYKRRTRMEEIRRMLVGHAFGEARGSRAINNSRATLAVHCATPALGAIRL